MTKQLTVMAGACLITVALSAFQLLKTDELTISPEASTIEWFAEKVTGGHNGTVALKEGSVTITDGTLSGGSFVVDMTSIDCADLDEPYQTKLERHLHSDDFFSTESHPTSTFVINKVTPADEGKFNTLISGDLTIKGITHPVEFPAKVKLSDGKFAAYGEMVIDRTKYDVRYGSSSFFEGLGDRAIYDEFTMKVSIGAKR